MFYHKNQIQMLCLGAMVLLLPMAGCVGFTSHRAKEHRSSQATYVVGEAIHVQTRNGSVKVLVDPSRTDIGIEAEVYTGGSSVQEAESRLSTVKIVADHGDNNTLTISADFSAGVVSNDGCSFVITTPGVVGVDIKTGNGSITLTGTSGLAVVRTSNGSITITQHDGAADLDTSNGRIQAIGVTGDVTGETSNGKFILESISGTVNMSTSNGSIRFKPASDSTAPFNFSTSNGSVTIEIPQDFNGTIDARTSNGSVKVTGVENRSVPVVIEDLNKKRHRKIVLSVEGPQSTIRTSNGTVNIVLMP